MDHALRLVSGLATVTAALLLSATATAIAAPPGATQELARLNYATDAFSSPDAASTPVETVSQLRPITGEQTVLPVLDHATDATGAGWVNVLLPGRPNSHTGWISTLSTTPAVTSWHLTIRTSRRQVTAFRDGRRVRSFRAVVGKASTPTPLGRFFVEEAVHLNQGDAGAPYALALSARSDVLQEFAGGPGQTAVHGTNNIGGVPGTAVSHGCIRLDPRAITWLATRLGPGTPVTISR